MSNDQALRPLPPTPPPATSSPRDGSSGTQQAANGSPATGSSADVSSDKVLTTEEIAPTAKRIDEEYWNAVACRLEHLNRARWWDRVARSSRTLVTLTSGVSALSLISDNIVMSTIFALITAAVAALNSGFNPSESAKLHRDTATQYGHLRRPLDNLRARMQRVEYQSGTAYAPELGQYYEAGYYYTTGEPVTHGILLEIQKTFEQQRQQLESIEEAAPTINEDKVKQRIEALISRSQP